MIELMLAFPPSLNSYYRHVGNKVLISKRGRIYRQSVVSIITLMRLRRFANKRIQVAILMQPPDNRRRDVDNYMKVIFDSITHSGLWNDDSQVDKLSIERGDVIQHGMMVVRMDVI